MATNRQHLLAACRAWQARNRVRFTGGQGVQEGSEPVSHGTWREDLRARRGFESRDRGVSTGPTQARFGQLAEKPARRPDPRSSVGGRQPDLGLEDLSQSNDWWNGESESL